MEKLVLPAFALFALSACDPSDVIAMNFTVDGTTVVAEGEIDATTEPKLKDILEDNPQITQLVLQNIGGSVDDEANLALGRFVRRSGLGTLVPSDGLVASGGTDLFLAGTPRILENGACVGIHAWADGNNRGARSYPRDDPEHTMYLEYYDDVGVPRDFYWHTLDAAPANEMHWMDANELDDFDLVDAPVQQLSGSNICDNR